MQKRITIGIDPDVDKNGMAIFNHEDSQLSLYEFDLSDLFMQLLKHKAICQKNKVELTVRLEAGHRVKRTWQARTVGTIKNVGRNNEIGAQIEKFLVKHSFKHELVEPCGLSKYKHDQFCSITNWDKKKATNPEKRVAGLLAFKR